MKPELPEGGTKAKVRESCLLLRQGQILRRLLPEERWGGDVPEEAVGAREACRRRHDERHSLHVHREVEEHIQLVRFKAEKEGLLSLLHQGKGERLRTREA